MKFEFEASSYREALGELAKAWRTAKFAGKAPDEKAAWGTALRLLTPEQREEIAERDRILRKNRRIEDRMALIVELAEKLRAEHGDGMGVRAFRELVRPVLRSMGRRCENAMLDAGFYKSLAAAAAVTQPTAG